MTQAFNLSQLANNLDSSGRLDATDGLVNAVPVANGGTGASSVPAAVSNLSSSIYPVGSIYINAAVTINPSILLGFGTWVAFGSGRVMVGLNVGDASFDVLQETGGSKDAIVVSHTHTAAVNDPGHVHAGGARSPIIFGSGSNPEYKVPGQQDTALATTGITVSNSTTGSPGTNANLQPYITVCMWLRTA